MHAAPVALALVALAGCADAAGGARGEGASCEAERPCADALLCVDGRCVTRPAPWAPPDESLPPLAHPDVVARDAADAADAADDAEDGAEGDGAEADADDVPPDGWQTRLVLAPHDALVDPSDARLGLAGGQAAVRQVTLPEAASVLGVEVVLGAPEGSSAACALYEIVLWGADAFGDFPIAPLFRSEPLRASPSDDPVHLDLPEPLPVPAGPLRFGVAYQGPCEGSFPPWVVLDASGDTSDTFVWANAWIPGSTLGLDGRWGLSLAIQVR